MSRPTLAVDIDEVLFPFVEEFVLHHNDRYATELAKEDFVSYHFEEIIPDIDVLEAIRRVKEFTNTHNLLAEPVKDAKVGVERLSKKFDITLLTARHPDYRQNTERWLGQHFPGMFRDLLMIGYERDNTIASRTKAGVCKEIGAVALVDDSLTYISQAAEIGVPGILFGDYPWNRADQLPQGVTRVQNWIEVAEHFDNASR